MNTVNTSPIARNIKETIDIGAYEFGSTGIIPGNKYKIKFNNITASPNPFKSSTVISYYLASPGDVTVTICSCNGKMIASFHKKQQERGSYSIKWDGLDDNNTHLKSGIFILTVKSGTFLRSVRLIKF
jgi:flagellar hook assembly protein FlgD